MTMWQLCFKQYYGEEFRENNVDIIHTKLEQKLPNQIKPYFFPKENKCFDNDGILDTK